MQSFSEQLRKNKHILYDLFVTIENIIIGNTFITKSFKDGCNKYEIISRLNQPTILLEYEETASGEFIQFDTALVSRREINYRRIIYDLFVTIENIIIGASSITREVDDWINTFIITPIRNQPIVIILYKLPSESENNTSLLQQIAERQNHISENIPYIRKPNSSEFHFANTDVTALEATRQQKETELLNLVSVETVPNEVQKNTSCVKSSSQELVSLISSEFEVRKSDFTDNKLCFKELREIKAGPPRSCPQFTRSEHKKIHETHHAGKKLYKCDYCEKTFAYSSFKNCHERQHTGEKPYKCDYCERVFAQLPHKKRHERQHTGEKPFKCEYCEKAFADSSTKKCHERQHTGEKPYKCDYCEKIFAQLSNKKSHERKHNGKKPFKCQYCEKTFADSSSKNRHEKWHDGEKPYKCEYCKKTFADLSNKGRHERLHTGEKPYKCDKCEKIFAHLPHKRRHERLHTGEKPFKCEHCEKVFANSSSKKCHERQHTGEKPYKCDYCEKMFANSSSKKRHERRHTEERHYKCD